MIFAAFIEGQFGEVGSSTGMSVMAHEASSHGILAGTYQYTQLPLVNAAFKLHQAKKHLLAAVCYSLGCETGCLISTPLDLLICLDPSRDGYQYRVPARVKRSILFHNNNWLSHLTGIGAAGEATDPGGDLGFQIKHEIDENHLLVDLDPSIHQAVLSELLKLKA